MTTFSKTQTAERSFTALLSHCWSEWAALKWKDLQTAGAAEVSQKWENQSWQMKRRVTQGASFSCRNKWWVSFHSILGCDLWDLRVKVDGNLNVEWSKFWPSLHILTRGSQNSSIDYDVYFFFCWSAVCKAFPHKCFLAECVLGKKIKSPVRATIFSAVSDLGLLMFFLSKPNTLPRLKVICHSVESTVCVVAAYLTDFGGCEDHVKDSWPAGYHSCGDCVGQRYHQEPQVAKKKEKKKKDKTIRKPH